MSKLLEIGVLPTEWSGRRIWTFFSCSCDLCHTLMLSYQLLSAHSLNMNLIWTLSNLWLSHDQREELQEPADFIGPLPQRFSIIPGFLVHLTRVRRGKDYDCLMVISIFYSVLFFSFLSETLVNVKVFCSFIVVLLFWNLYVLSGFPNLPHRKETRVE